MSGSVNKAIIIGNLGKDPEMKTLANGTGLCKFSVATSETWLKDGEKQESTEWHNIVVWGKQAEACGKYLAKGRKVYVEGKIQTRSWDDDSGQKHYMTEIKADKVVFLGSKGDAPSSGREQGRQTYKAPQQGAFGDGDDSSDIPF